MDGILPKPNSKCLIWYPAKMRDIFNLELKSYCVIIRVYKESAKGVRKT